MKYKLILIFGLLLPGMASFAQNTHFTVSGTIEFERKTNMYAVLQKMITKDEEIYYGPAIDQYKKSQPQFKILKSNVSFSDNKMLFKPVPEETIPTGLANTPLATQNNVVYTDFTTGTRVVQKDVFGEIYLLKDSIRKIKWKITDETSEVSGYTCRRANGIMMDSIYVVAFYTTEIPVSGGPESFSGLPGMILKVALPHENVIWTATKVTDTSLPVNTVLPPKKGKPTDYKGLLITLRSVMKSWGAEGQSYLRTFLL